MGNLDMLKYHNEHLNDQQQAELLTASYGGTISAYLSHKYFIFD